MNVNSHEEHNRRIQNRWMDTSIHITSSPFPKASVHTEHSISDTADTRSVSLFEDIIHSPNFNPFDIFGVTPVSYTHLTLPTMMSG